MTVRELPTPSISGISTICPNGSTTLTATPATTYRWSTGDTLGSITVYPTADTVYSVSVTDEYGCSGSTSYPVHISPLPVVAISGQLEFCSGNSTTLTVTPGYTYLWSTQATANSITVSDANTYTVTAYNEIGCQSTASVTTTVHALPELNFLGDSAVLTVTGANTYRWDNGSTGARIIVVPTAQTTYRVTGTNNTPCSSDNSFTVSIRQLPTPTISGNNSICQGESSQFVATGGQQYRWSTGVQGDRITVSEANTYSVTATDQYGCKGTTTRDLTVHERPDALISGNSHFCAGQTGTLRAMPNNCTYRWSHDEQTQQNVTISSGGTYMVTVTNTYGCSNTASKEVVLDTVPILNITGTSAICIGDSAVLTVSGANTYRWDNGSTDARIVVFPTTQTTYRVTGTNNTPCSNDNSFTIAVRDLPVPSITGNNTICQGENVVFVANGGQQYRWSTGVQGDRITPTA